MWIPSSTCDCKIVDGRQRASEFLGVGPKSFADMEIRDKSPSVNTVQATTHPNPRFAAENTLMYFSDGQKAVNDLIPAVKEAG